jgi:hypothetical protein
MKSKMRLLLSGARISALIGVCSATQARAAIHEVASL